MTISFRQHFGLRFGTRYITTSVLVVASREPVMFNVGCKANVFSGFSLVGFTHFTGHEDPYGE
jgi:hypothetical protein